MQTLYDRLRPQYKEALSKSKNEYPTLVNEIVKSLKEKYIWAELTVGQTRDLISFSDEQLGSVASYDWSYGDKFLNPREK